MDQDDAKFKYKVDCCDRAAGKCRQLGAATAASPGSIVITVILSMVRNGSLDAALGALRRSAPHQIKPRAAPHRSG